ncbi:glycosyltransferase family 4 protein [Pontibacter sp. SGAir0037]|uniref:glycosyltransferase family 4 protein n=1 Tax=Pontibacter sp. SGAir0037 TaxID=2571030 RepID=UPI0010CCCD15|nr:glycosyltransferase family 4 protein [Pontibacter sp. SGAir0037]QCR22826.1 hypothetical protein C1N53_11050 [Pontibacter sp. SGAir0037]
MRILLVHNHYKISAGEDTVFYAEAALMEEHGHQVEMLTLSNNDVNTISEKLGAALGVVYNTKSAKLVEEKLLTYKPDVVHVHNFFPLISPAVFYVVQKHQVPVVMTLHNFRLICPSSYLHYNGQVHMENIHKVFPWKAIRDKAYRNSFTETASVVLATGVHKLLGTWRERVDRFIALTPGASELFLNSSLKLSPQQLVVKPNFTADLGLGAGSRAPYFLYVGRLSPEKGVETLLRAAADYPFKLKIIGDGSLKYMVEEYAGRFANIEYLGYQKRDRVVQELKLSTALIFPSEWPEMFGMSVIEAFSTGTPVIASKIGGGEQLVQDGVNGFHYSPGKAEELVAKVKLLEQDNTLWNQFSKNARNSYEDNYTAEVNYQLLLRIYEDVIRNRKTRVQSQTAVGEPLST